MPSLTLDSQNRTQFAEWLNEDTWIVVCLCAAWCDTCRAYRNSFDELAARHSDKRFVWIDIEDEADLVGDFDVENFPTLLIQRGDIVAFFGTMLPDMKVADRLIQSLAARTPADLQAEAHGNIERQDWQRNCNLRTRLNESCKEEGSAQR